MWLYNTLTFLILVTENGVSAYTNVYVDLFFKLFSELLTHN